MSDVPHEPSFKVLLIEDDQFKQELIESAVREVRRTDLRVGRSVQQAVQLVRAEAFDLIILDIALPSHESRPGGAQPIPQPSGGLEVLLELSYEARRDKVLILTQYPEIEFDGALYPLERFQRQISRSINADIIGVVLFSAQDKQWRDEIERVLA